MSIYNEQYKQYYEGLNSKARYNRLQEQPVLYNGYGGYGRSNKKKTAGNLSSWIDIIITQLVVTLVLIATILYMKNSSDLEVTQAFKTFKNSVSKEVSYSEMYKKIKKVDIDSIAGKAKSSFNWIKEKMDENPLNY